MCISPLNLVIFPIFLNRYINGIILDTFSAGHPGHAYVKETLYNFTQFFNAEKIGETNILLDDMTEYSNMITGKLHVVSAWLQHILKCSKGIK